MKRRLGVVSTEPEADPGRLGPPSTNKRLKINDPFLTTKKSSVFEEEDDPPTSTSIDEKGPGLKGIRNAFNHDDDETDSERKAAEKAAPKPTLYLQCLPVGTSEVRIKSLIPSSLKIDSVRPLPTRRNGGGPSERPSRSAIVTLDRETPARDIDAAVNNLQNCYIGFGCYLNISRHLSSATLESSLSDNSALYSVTRVYPFGAEAHRSVRSSERYKLSRAPPPQDLDAPSWRQSTNLSHRDQPWWPEDYRVQVTPPRSIKQLRMVHNMVDRVLKYGPKFEAFFMNIPKVQEDEKWAWLFDRRSRAGVYYLWRLWEIKSGYHAKRKLSAYRGGDNRAHRIFEGRPKFVEPDGLDYEFVTKFEDLVKQSEYDSSDEEDVNVNANMGERKRRVQRRASNDQKLGVDEETEGSKYLTPLRKAQLVHLLGRLPDTIGTLRRGDIARITSFACRNAYAAEEIVELVVMNVIAPLCYSTWAPGKKGKDANASDSYAERPTFGAGLGSKVQDQAGPDVQVADVPHANSKEQEQAEHKQDQSAAKHVALYVINDILSGPPATGVPGAWRYRGLFESLLFKYQVFAHLGRLDRDYGWGRIKAEKWQRSTKNILDLWESHSMFDIKTHEKLVHSFYHPPLTKDEQVAEERKTKEKQATEQKQSRWKSVESKEAKSVRETGKADSGNQAQVEQEARKEQEKSETSSKSDNDKNQDAKEDKLAVKVTTSAPKQPEPVKRGRIRAEDMFNDSD